MSALFKIDGRSYNVGVEKINRTATLEDGPNASKAISGKRWRDLKGTFLAYKMVISSAGMSQADYDALFEVLSAPVDFHMVSLPYGQGTKEFEAYIEVVDDGLDISTEEENTWGGLTVLFTSREAIKKPSV